MNAQETPTEETREYEILSYGVSDINQPTLRMLCPFCGASVKAYLWSLAGSGKKCECGAKFDYYRKCRKKV